MTAVRPNVLILGDNERRTMWRKGYVHAWTTTLSTELVLWCFGFKQGGPEARVWGLEIKGPGGLLWVMARPNGEVLMKERADGPRRLPPIMRQILDA